MKKKPFNKEQFEKDAEKVKETFEPMSNQHIQKQIESIKKDFKDALRNVVANAILKKASGKPVFTTVKIIGQIDLTVEHYIKTIWKEAQKETAEDICVIIDKIEALSETNTLEEWRQYKHIRNAIRDKYL